MSINLKKGQSIDLRKKPEGGENNLSKLTIGLGWDINDNGADYDLDACALLLINNKLESSFDVVSYKNKKHNSGKLWSTGDNLTGAGDGDDEQLIVLLDSIPEKYNKIIFYATIYQGKSRRQYFSKVSNAFIRAVDANGTEIAKYDISGSSEGKDMCSLVFAEVERIGNEWKFNTIGNMYSTDRLDDIVNMYKTVQTDNNNSTSQSTQEQPRKKLFGLF